MSKPDCEYFQATEEQVESIKKRLCPVECPFKEEGPFVKVAHLKKSAPTPNFKGFLHGYWCNKYRSVLGAHVLRPSGFIFGGSIMLVVMKSPFCPDAEVASEQEQ
ncbi:MAG: hypothetical protein PHI96_03945 [Desulfovibrio sp.]|nr:hypothetical protein [Desulfovibrio sp.]